MRRRPAAPPARCCSRATRTRRASSSASSRFRESLGPGASAPARERGARARARARADRAPGAARRPRITRSIPAWCSPRSRAPACPPACDLREHARARRASGRRRQAATPRLTRPASTGHGRHARRRLAPSPPSRWCSPPVPGASSIAGCPPARGVPVRPVKGQILRLRDPAGPGLLRARAALPRRLPRAARGRRATCSARPSRSAASSSRPPPAACTSCCATRTSWCRASASCEIEELSVGLRPGTPDNAPAIGPGAPAGLMWATGHYRNGILLAPLTAELVVGLLAAARSPLLRWLAERLGQRPSGRARAVIAAASPHVRPRPRSPCVRRRRGAGHVIVLNGRALRGARRRDRGRRARAAGPRRATRAASRWRSTARSCRAPAGSRSRCAEDARVEVLTAMQGG